MSLITPQTLTKTFNYAQPLQTKKIISNICKILLSDQIEPNYMQSYLNFLFKICFLKNNQNLLHFLLFRIPWFEPSFIKYTAFLQKTIKLYRGEGKQATRVGYNILCEALISSKQIDSINEIICNLLEGRYDNQIFLNSLKQNYPHKNRNLQIHKNYLRGLFNLSIKKSALRSHILQIVIQQLSTIDTQLKIGDNQLTQPYIKEEQLLNKRKEKEQMGDKLDELLMMIIQFVKQDEEIGLELLMIFHKKVLITEKNKYIQFIIFYICEKNKKVLKYFLSLVTNNILEQEIVQQSSCKQAYLNNIFYLGGYLVRSSQCSLKKIQSCLKDILLYLKKKLQIKPHIQNIPSLNLQQLCDQNQNLLYMIQLVLYVCTYRINIINYIHNQLDIVLQMANHKTCYYMFINQQILKRFRYIYGLPFQHHNICQNNYLLFQNKFNPILLTNLSKIIDPCYLFYYHQEIHEQHNHKRKASIHLQKNCHKKIKKDEKDSHHSDQSTTFFKL